MTVASEPPNLLLPSPTKDKRKKASSMSSGFGFNGREGRCYRFWKDVEQCSKDTEYSGQCGKQVEDYLECLHHKKELTRMNIVIAKQEQQEAAARHGGGDHGHDAGH